MEEARKTSNYSVLKKHDPCLDKVIFSSSICDVYEFDIALEQWVPIHQKGTVFLYSRISDDSQPYAILVMNRLKPTDFKINIVPRMRSVQIGEKPTEAQIQDSTIMIQQGGDKVFGLWLFEESDRQHFLDLINWCLTNGTI